MNAALAALGLPDDALPADVKRAYYALVKVHHPDHGGTPEGFADLNRRYREALDAARARPCPTCRGSGKVYVTAGFSTLKTVCETCSGTGRPF